MEGNFVNDIERIAKENQVIDIGEKKFSPSKFMPILHEPKAETLKISTLSGLVDYLISNNDNLTNSDLIIHVESPNEVRLISKISGETRFRDIFVEVDRSSDSKHEFQFDSFMPLESFIIKLRSLFVPNEDLDTLSAFVSKITSKSEITLDDDGIGQTIALQKGLSSAVKENKVAPIKVNLKPFRTFNEIEQVESTFLFRLRSAHDDSVGAALFEADGGMWESVARYRIKEWIAQKLGEAQKEITIIA